MEFRLKSLDRQQTIIAENLDLLKIYLHVRLHHIANIETKVSTLNSLRRDKLDDSSQILDMQTSLYSIVWKMQNASINCESNSRDP